MITSRTGAPADYAELYQHYFGMMKSIAAKSGIHPQDVEDVASEILCTFMKKDALTWFDPHRINDAGENPRTAGPRYREARFSNLLRSFTSLYCRQWVDKQNNRSYREPDFAKLDAPVGEAESDTWGDVQDRWQAVDMEKSVESRLMLVSVMTTAQSRAQQLAEDAEASANETVWKLRKQAQDAARDAQRHHEGMRAVLLMAESGVAITGSSLARECGWSPKIGAEVLRGVRQELKAVGL